MRPTVKLGEICDILDKKRRPITQKDRTKGIYPYYGASGILDYVADYIFDEDLVLIGEDGAKRGALDNSAFKVSGKVWVNNHAHVIRPHREKILDDFLVYFLVSSDLSDYITGTTVPKLNQERLKLIEIPLPPLETQKAIVAKLDQIFAELDQTKSEIQKNLDNTDELWKSALNQAFQGDWEMKKLGEIYDITSSKRVFQKDWRTSGVPFYRAREIVKLAENGFVDNELFITEEMYEEYGKKYGLPKENDIMVTGVGTIGICYFVKKTDKFYFKDGNILWFKHNFEGINSRFVEYLFKSELLKSQINNGASTVVATLTIEKAKGLIIPVPPLSEQEKIVEHLDQVSKEVKALKSQYQSQLDNLEELKKSVLDKAFRGELGE